MVKAVQDLVGNCARFDFQEISDELPKIDLPALRPFFLSMLKLNRRRVEQRDDSVAFRTPAAWQTEPGIFPAYQDMVFRREVRGRDAARRVLGVGHKVMNAALRQALDNTATVATLPADTLSQPLVVYRVRDRLTGEQRSVRTVILAVEISAEVTGADVVLKDWSFLKSLMGFPLREAFAAQILFRLQRLKAFCRLLTAAFLSCDVRHRRWDFPFALWRSTQLLFCGPLCPRAKNKGQKMRKRQAKTKWVVKFTKPSTNRGTR